MHSGRQHGFAEIQRAADVVAIIEEWLFDRFPNRFQTGKMNDRIIAFASQNRQQSGIITYIDLEKLWPPPADFFNAVEHHEFAVGKIIDYAHIITGFQQLHTGVTADIPGSTGKKYLHAANSFQTWSTGRRFKTEGLFNY